MINYYFPFFFATRSRRLNYAEIRDMRAGQQKDISLQVMVPRFTSSRQRQFGDLFVAVQMTAQQVGRFKLGCLLCLIQFRHFGFRVNLIVFSIRQEESTAISN